MTHEFAKFIILAGPASFVIGLGVYDATRARSGLPAASLAVLGIIFVAYLGAYMNT